MYPQRQSRSRSRRVAFLCLVAVGRPQPRSLGIRQGLGDQGICFAPMSFRWIHSQRIPKSLREIKGGLLVSEGKLRHPGKMPAPDHSTLAYANRHCPWQVYETPFTLLYEHVPAKWKSAQRALALELPAKRLRLGSGDRFAAFALVPIALQEKPG